MTLDNEKGPDLPARAFMIRKTVRSGSVLVEFGCRGAKAVERDLDGVAVARAVIEIENRGAALLELAQGVGRHLAHGLADRAR